jgi:repressor LexA
MARQTEKKKPSASGGRPVIDTERRTHVGQVIRKYRLAAGMDQPTLAKQLGYTKTAIGNWELGLSRPDIDNVPKICRLLNIPVTELLDLPAETALPIEDRNLLFSYHQLDKFNRHTILQMMDRLLFQQDSKEKERLRNSYIGLTRYEDAAAAGVGGPMLEYAENETVYALSSHVPYGTDSIIHVNGRSMEPTYPDGSYVYVDTSAEVQEGQVGIFIVNGEAYIKEYQHDALYSHNQRYKPIPIHPDTEMRCCGRVTGIVGEKDIANAILAEKIEAAFAEEDE